MNVQSGAVGDMEKVLIFFRNVFLLISKKCSKPSYKVKGRIWKDGVLFIVSNITPGLEGPTNNFILT